MTFPLHRNKYILVDMVTYSKWKQNIKLIFFFRHSGLKVLWWIITIKIVCLLRFKISLYSDTKILSKYIPSAETIINDAFSYSEKVWKSGSQQKCQRIFFINVWLKSVFDIYFPEFGTALTPILPIVFQYCYKYCYSDSRNLWAVMKAGGLALQILIQPTIALEMPVPSQGHYGFHSFPVVDWFCLFI